MHHEPDSQSTKQSSNGTNPAFLIEMSHQLRHIIMKRSYFLRSTRARTLFCLEKIAGKSWLEVALIEKPKADVLPWDQAHNVAEHFKAELKDDVFVEPANKAGRHHQLTAPQNSTDPLSGPKRSDSNRGIGAFDFDPMAGMFGSSARRNRSANDQFGIGIMSNSGIPSIPGLPNVGGHSPFNAYGLQNQDSADFLPAHVREVLSFGEKSSEITLPPLRDLPIFAALPETTKQMYEVEAVQVLQGLMAQVGPAEHSEQSLFALVKLDSVSKHLKRFLVEALPASV